MCVGAFTLAAPGLLDGRRATTHWQWAGELARRYPYIDVDPGVLFVDRGPDPPTRRPRPGARRLLESTRLTVDRVAEQSGFGSYRTHRSR
jgi:transcriptional regulator GlxA family with amidase domain